MNKVNYITIPRDARIIVISDIHGELDLFKKLLDKVSFSREDYLILNGDLCEKGNNSTGVVRFVMELTESHPHVLVTEGNCDTLVEDVLEENPKLMNYLHSRKHSIIHEWLQEIGFTLTEETEVIEIKEQLNLHFANEMEWLMKLPTAIEADDYIFVHGGLEDREDWMETDRITAITMRAFLEKSHRADKYVIVGHWPVVNYATDIPSNNPIIDETKKIIAIDGGNIIKRTGQLNAFIIDRTAEGDAFSHTYLDHFPVFEVKEDFQPQMVSAGSISFPVYELQPVQASHHFTACKQDGREDILFVKNEYIRELEPGNFTAISDVSCAHISVKKGDIVSLIDDCCTGYDLIKKDGGVGWIKKGILVEYQEKSVSERLMLNM
ncbi:metallophosphoesterase [Rossellomorea aquimaris]|uniref:metallophosphoesterase n=1 Tax=Rossellomorea aquimaris TaxID=189382 RepID=UPI001CD348E3|nr:metallophosphoesterase [Rossellomorea aquimaris]MCA1055779.1 metallophosphoesterase [Rossellomorea aquimaris]